MLTRRCALLAGGADLLFAHPLSRSRSAVTVRQQSQAIAVTGDAMYFSERAKLQELMQTTNRCCCERTR